MYLTDNYFNIILIKLFYYLLFKNINKIKYKYNPMW